MRSSSRPASCSPDGRPIPELVIGPFGVAIVHELEGARRLRQVGQGWETRTRDGWVPTEGPLEGVARDAERVRHWLANGDLDYVVRVYAALVTTDAAIPRSPLCAVISERSDPGLARGAPPPAQLQRRAPEPPAGAGPRRAGPREASTERRASAVRVGW